MASSSSLWSSTQESQESFLLDTQSTLIFRRRRFIWTIHNFDEKMRTRCKCSKEKESLISEPFHVNDALALNGVEKTESNCWTMTMNFKKFVENGDGWDEPIAVARMDIKLSSASDWLGHLSFRIAGQSEEQAFPNVFPTEYSSGQQEIATELTEKTVTVIADFEYAVDQQSRQRRGHNMSQDLRDLIELMEPSGFKTDFAIVCGERTFDVHKTILAARSGFFRTLFRQEPGSFAEATSNEVRIDDVTPEVIEIFLKFIEIDEISEEDLRAHSHDLFALAHRYEVKGLREVCRDFIGLNVDAKNYLEVLLLWSTYDDEEEEKEEKHQAVRKAARILQENLEEAKKSEMWKELEKGNPRRLVGLLTLLASTLKLQ